MSKAIVETTSGNYIGIGYSLDTINGQYVNRLNTIGINNQGQVQWVKKFGKKKLEYLDNPTISQYIFKQGSYFYAVFSVRDSNNKQIGAFVKFDFNGDTIWQRFYRNNVLDVTPEMVTNSVDGGFLLSGFFQSWTGGGRPCLLIKTDANGNELWRKQINKTIPNVSDAKAIVQDNASKKIVMVGYQYLGTTQSFKGYDHILIVDSLGNLISRHNYMPFPGGAYFDLIQTSDGNFVAVGGKEHPQTIGGYFLEQGFAVKFNIDSPNVPIWKIDGLDKITLGNKFTSVFELPNDDMWIGGCLDTVHIENKPEDFLMRHVLIDKNGQVKKKRYYNYKTSPPGDSNLQSLYCLKPTIDGGLIAAIQDVSSNTNIAPNPFFFVKYDSTGCDSTYEYCKMLAEVGVNEFQLADFSLRIYPNPFSNLIKINIHSSSISNQIPLVFSITDISGKLLLTEQLNSIQTEHSIETKDLSKGLYFLNASLKGRKYSFKILKE